MAAACSVSELSCQMCIIGFIGADYTSLTLCLDTIGAGVGVGARAREEAWAGEESRDRAHSLSVLFTRSRVAATAKYLMPGFFIEAMIRR